MKKNKKEKKLKIKDIKKSSDSEISHSIVKAKIEEKKLVLAMALMVVILVAIVVCFVFTAMSVEKIDGKQTGHLYVVFKDNKDGMGDVVDFSGDNLSYSNSVKITNYKENNSWYKIVLEDYYDLINYHGCGDSVLNPDKIYFSIDNSEPIVLSSVYTGNGYLLSEGEISLETDVEHQIKIWHDEYSQSHYHGKVVVSFVK